jgi:hypothetical protein
MKAAQECTFIHFQNLARTYLYTNVTPFAPIPVHPNLWHTLVIPSIRDASPAAAVIVLLAGTGSKTASFAGMILDRNPTVLPTQGSMV